MFLFMSFAVQPIHQAMANEGVSEETVEQPAVAESVKEQVKDEPVITAIEITDENIVEEDLVSEEVTEEIEVQVPEEIDVPDSDEDVITATTTGTVTEEKVASSTTEVTDDESSNVATSTDSENTSSGSGGSGSDAGTETEVVEDDVATSTATSTSDIHVIEDEEDTEVQDDTVSTTTDEANTETPVIEAEILLSEDNFYQFSKQSCVAVGDGTFHCSSNELNSYDSKSVVYAELGESGNMEIFLQTSDDAVRQITDNEYDDTAPYYDPETLQIAWQRLIDDRHQVILYDIAKDKESQLTFSRTNNMEPKVSVDGVVWQAWDNNDWEIMYFDGQFTDQITDNNTQDVAPVIRDKYILWTVIGRSDQEAKVYSLDSKEILTISGYDGGIIENPRFVLVYDTKFENGDVITQGFDPTTGISQPIAAQPAPDPVDIPLPDPIGEIRALIQNKSTFEDEVDADLGDSGGKNSTSTATSSDTLNLKDNSDGDIQISTTTDSVSDVFELTEFDLILTETEINFEELDEIEELLDEETLDISNPNSSQS